MALTKIITKVMPTENRVGFHLELKDDGVVVIDKDYRERFSQAAGATTAIKLKIGKHVRRFCIDQLSAVHLINENVILKASIVKDYLTRRVTTTNLRGRIVSDSHNARADKHSKQQNPYGSCDSCSNCPFEDCTFINSFCHLTVLI